MGAECLRLRPIRAQFHSEIDDSKTIDGIVTGHHALHYMYRLADCIQHIALPALLHI